MKFQEMYYNSTARKLVSDHIKTFDPKDHPQFPIGSKFKIIKGYMGTNFNEGCDFKVVGYYKQYRVKSGYGYYHTTRTYGNRIKFNESPRVPLNYILLRLDKNGCELKSTFGLCITSIQEKLKYENLELISDKLDLSCPLPPARRALTGDSKRKNDRKNYSSGDWYSILEQLECKGLFYFTKQLNDVSINLTNLSCNDNPIDDLGIDLKYCGLVKDTRYKFLINLIALELNKTFEQAETASDDAYDNIELFKKMKLHLN
jgi:hypothetical protein